MEADLVPLAARITPLNCESFSSGYSSLSPFSLSMLSMLYLLSRRSLKSLLSPADLRRLFDYARRPLASPADLDPPPDLHRSRSHVGRRTARAAWSEHPLTEDAELQTGQAKVAKARSLRWPACSQPPAHSAAARLALTSTNLCRPQASRPPSNQADRASFPVVTFASAVRPALRPGECTRRIHLLAAYHAWTVRTRPVR